MNSSIHSNGPGFEQGAFLVVRQQTQALLNELRKCVKVGLKESEVILQMQNQMKSSHISKNWHPIKFRVDKNTTLSFSDQPLYDPIITGDSIYFIDIGPVINGYEGDYGETFYEGSNPDIKFLQASAHRLFNFTRTLWLKERLSGKELYTRAERYALELGLKLNNRMDGHRLGDFPHQIFFKGGLAEIDDRPVEDVWVLEIHLLDPRLGLGSFFEDILTERNH